MDSYIPFKEFINGIKSTNASRFYSTLLLSRRVIFVALLVFGENISNIGLIYPMIILQIIYLVQLTIIRPYNQIKDNIIEITNEWFYFLLVALLSYYNTKESWIGMMENAYLWIILGNSLIIIVVMIGKNKSICKNIFLTLHFKLNV